MYQKSWEFYASCLLICSSSTYKKKSDTFIPLQRLPLIPWYVLIILFNTISILALIFVLQFCVFNRWCKHTLFLCRCLLLGFILCKNSSNCLWSELAYTQYIQYTVYTVYWNVNTITMLQSLPLPLWKTAVAFDF